MRLMEMNGMGVDGWIEMNGNERKWMGWEWIPKMIELEVLSARTLGWAGLDVQ